MSFILISLSRCFFNLLQLGCPILFFDDSIGFSYGDSVFLILLWRYAREKEKCVCPGTAEAAQTHFAPFQQTQADHCGNSEQLGPR
jgi:hypothetical protein